MSLCFVAGATATMWGIKSHRTLHMFIAGAGVSMTLLADTRGIVWALPWLCGLLFVILFRGSPLSKLSRLIALSIPLYVSHQWAPSFYVFDAIGIEPQVDIRPSLYHWLKIYPPPYEYDSNFTRGMAPSQNCHSHPVPVGTNELVVPPSDRDAGQPGRAIAKFYWEWVSWAV